MKIHIPSQLSQRLEDNMLSFKHLFYFPEMDTAQCKSASNKTKTK
jgi:hypothetical protein